MMDDGGCLLFVCLFACFDLLVLCGSFRTLSLGHECIFDNNKNYNKVH